jgi:DNA-binding NtrC family response regulator
VASILLVDDDDMILTVLSVYLRSEGHDIVTALDGNKAMAIVQSTQLDLVISDLRMNPISGLELLKMIKAEKPALPVILLTAFASAKTAREADQLGAFGYLSKPFTNDEVLQTVDRAIASGRSAGSGPPPIA